MTDEPTETATPDEADGLDPDAPGTSVLGLQPGDPVEPNEPA